MGESPSGELNAPGRSQPLDLDSTEDHNYGLENTMGYDSPLVRLRPGAWDGQGAEVSRWQHVGASGRCLMMNT